MTWDILKPRNPLSVNLTRSPDTLATDPTLKLKDTLERPSLNNLEMSFKTNLIDLSTISQQLDSTIL
jgi:hypothetical protein